MGGVIGALAVGSAAAGAVVVPQFAKPLATRPYEPPPPVVVTQPTPAAPTRSVSPSPSASEEPSPRPASAFTTWAAPLAGRLAVPQTALEAYGYAEWVLQQTTPTCKLQWTTLAAVGKVTTDHGRQGGSTLDPQGRMRPALIGPPLNGTGGLAKVADTDAGALDGDHTWDHAVGPMQLIPSMWRQSGVDGNNDQLADPQDVDDAALAAAYYLCSSGKDLSVVANWKSAVSAYHGLASQLDKVFEEAQAYGVKSRS